jgi:hypothetical protein
LETLVEFFQQKREPMPSWKVRPVEMEHKAPIRVKVKKKVSGLLDRLRAKGIL